MGAAFRQAAVDLYYHSWRLVPANLAWAGMLVLVALAAAAWLPAVVLAAVLGVPFAGISRMAALIARGESVGFSDFGAGMRQMLRPALATGAATVGLAAVLVTNVVVGLEMGGIAGWSLAVLALYGLVGLAMVLAAWWPILTDPRRDGMPMGHRLRLAALVVLAHPGRTLGLALGLVILLALATVLLGALFLVAAAYVSLVASRAVLPLADRLAEGLDERLDERREERRPA